PDALQDPVLDARPTLAASATYGDARRVGEIYKAQRLHMAAEREKRSLLVRDEVESELVVQSRRIRDAWLNWPARVSAILAAAWGGDPINGQVDLDREGRAPAGGGGGGRARRVSRGGPGVYPPPPRPLSSWPRSTGRCPGPAVCCAWCGPRPPWSSGAPGRRMSGGWDESREARTARTVF